MSAQDYFYIEVDKGNKPTYGMTLLGSGPCIVSDVVANGAADLSGVRPGFVVLEIDGNNVISKNHKEVREIIRVAESNTGGSIQFKFATMDAACHFFGRSLRETFESSRSRRKSDGARPSASPKARKSDSNLRMAADSRQPSAEIKDNRPSHSVAVQVDYQMDSPPVNQARKLRTPPRERKPTQPRYGGEVTRRPHIHQTRDLTRWMMRTADPQNVSSPLNNKSSLSPAAGTTEFVCVYYFNLVDLLGPVEESVFREHVEALKVQPGQRFWARLVINDKRLTIFRREGKYVSYSQRNMRDVFVHEDGNFFGFTAVRLSQVKSMSPNQMGGSPAQTLDVYSCHIMYVDPELKATKARQREILSDLFGKDRLLVMNNSAGAYFPHSASDVASALRTLVKVESSPEDTMIVSKSRANASTVDLLKESQGCDDATANFNSASDLRNSMRKYGPYLGLNRHSISTENVGRLQRPAPVLVNSRLSCVTGLYANGLPQTIAETEVMISSLASSQSDGIGSMSSYDEEFERCLRREAVSSFDLTGRTGNDGFITPVRPIAAPMKKLELLDVLHDPKGLNLFQAFLKQEHSEENSNFWLACQDYRALKKSREIEANARKIFDRYLSVHASEPINVDSDVRNVIERNLKVATTCLFDTAAKQVFDLMNTDSFPRFVKSAYYGQLMQILHPDVNLFNKSMTCLDKKETNLGPSRNSGILGWLGKRSKTDSDTPRSGRQSLPVTVDSPMDQRRHSVVKNRFQKLIDKGRKSLSARVKSSRRESLMEWVGENRSPLSNPQPVPHINVSPAPFEFRKPLTPPPKMEVVVRRERKSQSASKEKRLSLQSFQRNKSKETTIPTEWTFSRSSLDGLENVGPAQSARLARESVSYVNFERNLKS
ncbi:uncharacterized protein LOC129585405 [Paramacrobiotus metropolitanus]|uniref:uncharacterized protein LOC129585405 n=1 Tax=Paramacrobiotus metropolitanus TaxID=2943436 RepID=UPI002445DF97|nr:uncharacterized protein LOC129585405 [Paramacrobiotus metropolitanus]